MNYKAVALFFILFSFLFTNAVTAQELNCKVQVVSQRATTTDQQVFKTLQTAIYEFMNNRKWTNDNYTNNERIECSIMLNITDDNGTGKFIATATIQSSRPVFNSSYNSVMLNISDPSWSFQYIQFQPLEYNDNVYLSNLTSLLAYYAYIIIGLDYDSYSLKGGSPYFDKAQQVLNTVPQSGEDASGWRAQDNLRNRYWLIENILNTKFADFRQVNYDYHRLGMDKMYDDAKSARTIITNSIKKLENTASSNPNSMILQQFFAAKSLELINVYSKAAPQEKAEMMNLLTKLDPVNGQKYSTIK
jgi:hypothetical protein